MNSTTPMMNVLYNIDSDKFQQKCLVQMTEIEIKNYL